MYFLTSLTLFCLLLHFSTILLSFPLIPGIIFEIIHPFQATVTLSRNFFATFPLFYGKKTEEVSESLILVNRKLCTLHPYPWTPSSLLLFLNVNKYAWKTTHLSIYQPYINIYLFSWNWIIPKFIWMRAQYCSKCVRLLTPEIWVCHLKNISAGRREMGEEGKTRSVCGDRKSVV